MGYPVKFNDIAFQMAGLGLLLEEESTTGDAVLLRQGLYCNNLVFVYDAVLRRVYGMEMYLVCKLFAKELQLRLH